MNYSRNLHFEPAINRADLLLQPIIDLLNYCRGAIPVEEIQVTEIDQNSLTAPSFASFTKFTLKPTPTMLLR